MENMRIPKSTFDQKNSKIAMISITPWVITDRPRLHQGMKDKGYLAYIWNQIWQSPTEKCVNSTVLCTHLSRGH